jgi:predicted transcriptional regulator
MNTAQERRTARVVALVKPSEAEALERLAQRSDRSLSQIARIALREFMAQQETR